jgi:hypothetical protein
VEKPYAKYHTREKSPWKGEALNPVFSVKTAGGSLRGKGRV